MKELEKKTSNSFSQPKRAANPGRKVSTPMTNSKAIGSKNKRNSTAMVAKSNLNSEMAVVSRLNSFEEVSRESSTGSHDAVSLENSKSKDGSDHETVSSYTDSLGAEDEAADDSLSRSVSSYNGCGVGVPPSSIVSNVVNNADSSNQEDPEEPVDVGELEDETLLNQRIDEMELRIEKLEEELREVAALEISLYSVVPEHGSSAHKVHTPARRLSRLYIHACKHLALHHRGSIAKNTASGFVLIAKSCGNDVPRLTFWLSNAIVLREIISQAFGTSKNSSTRLKIIDVDRNGTRTEKNPAFLKWKGNSASKHANGSEHYAYDWQETGAFTCALEKVESWIFSRIVESVWWQALTPHMQPPTKSSTSKSSVRMLGPTLGDQQQGNFSVSLWRNAFQDAFQRLCPVRAGGHDCGCLPIIAKMVMEQCVARLDVAMFNAILRESAHETPTDPISDPIVDSRVLPIPAGDLSFGSGAQLKNSIGNWTRWLSDMFGIDADDDIKQDHSNLIGDDDRLDSEYKSFNLLSDLSDLLMLPKDMLMDQTVRNEVCPSIDLSLVKRILCYFTPDEFCPDPVPGAVLEALNAQSVVERRVAADGAENFPYTAAPVVYSPPSTAAVAEKVAEAGCKSHLSRNVSIVQRKGYTSDEELEELDSPLASIIEGSASPALANGNKTQHRIEKVINSRYDLLRPVWSE